MNLAIKHRLEYMWVRMAAALLRILPLRVGLMLGWVVAFVMFYGLRWRRQKAEPRIQQVLGCSPKETRRIAFLSLRNLVFNIVELLRMTPRRAAKLATHPSFSFLSELYANHQKNFPGKGLIFATMHMGNWDLCGLACKSVGMPMFFIARRQKNPLTDELMNKMRGANGVETILNDSRVLRNVIRGLKSGKALAMLPDVRNKTKALEIDFMGGKANIGAGTALFARQTNVPIYPSIIIRKGWTRFEAFTLDPILSDPNLEKAEDFARITQLLLSQFDEYIRAHPEQYFWFNKRWILDPISG